MNQERIKKYITEKGRITSFIAERPVPNPNPRTGYTPKATVKIESVLLLDFSEINEFYMTNEELKKVDAIKKVKSLLGLKK